MGLSQRRRQDVWVKPRTRRLSLYPKRAKEGYMKCEIMEYILWIVGCILLLQLVTGNTKNVGPTIAALVVVWSLVESDSTAEDNKLEDKKK